MAARKVAWDDVTRVHAYHPAQWGATFTLLDADTPRKVAYALYDAAVRRTGGTPQPPTPFYDNFPVHGVFVLNRTPQGALLALYRPNKETFALLSGRTDLFEKWALKRGAEPLRALPAPQIDPTTPALTA